MCDTNDKITISHSCCSTSSPRSKKKLLDNTWKSDMFIPIEQNNTGADCTLKALYLKDSCGEYYKKYEHDEIPVKDFVTSSDIIGTGDSERIATITNSLLDRLEHKVLKQYESQELQTDGSSFESLDSHIKFFQTTVQEIFDTFYSNMRDYEIYKKRYNDILEKSKADTLIEMEEFIKDMIQHIVSAEPSNTSITSNMTYDLKDPEIKTSVLTNKFETIESRDSMLQSYKNNKFTGDSVTEENSSKKQSLQSGEIFNIYLMSNNPSVEIKVNDRNMCSEINVKDLKPDVDSKIASADNLRRFVVKKKEPEASDTQDTIDREIPIKISSPKKNIHLNEDFHCEHEKSEKSILSRLCSYLCKKFRRSA